MDGEHKNQITRLNGLLKELLSLAKMEEEKPALTMADFNISDAVYDAASPFTTLAETKGKNSPLMLPTDLPITATRVR